MKPSISLLLFLAIIPVCHASSDGAKPVTAAYRCKVNTPAFFDETEIQLNPINSLFIEAGHAHRYPIEKVSGSTENGHRIMSYSLKRDDQGSRVREVIEVDLAEPGFSQWRTFSLPSGNYEKSFSADCSLPFPKDPKNGDKAASQGEAKAQLDSAPGSVPPPPAFDGGNLGISY